MSIFATAGMCLQRVLDKNSSIKESVLGDDRVQAKGAVYALVCETLKRYHGILHLLRRSGLLKAASEGEQKQGNQFLLAVLVFEVLFGKNSSVKRAGAAGKLVLSWKSRLAGLIARDFRDNPELVAPAVRYAMYLQAKWPRYLRINPLKEGAIEAVRSAMKGGMLAAATVEPAVLDVLTAPASDTKGPKAGKRGKHAASSKPRAPNPPGLAPSLPSDLREFDLVKEGHLLQQDRSSCMPALALLASPSPGHSERGGASGRSSNGLGSSSGGGTGPDGSTCWPPATPFTVVDACAAPGNKTMQLASLLTRASGAGVASVASLAGAAGKAAAKAGSAPGSGASGAQSWSAMESGLPASSANRVLAFDRDPRRAALLKRRCEEHGAGTAVQCTLASFLDLAIDADGKVQSKLPEVPEFVPGTGKPRYAQSSSSSSSSSPASSPASSSAEAPSPEGLPPVRAVLLDPSCSGSGMVYRLERALEIAVGEAQRELKGASGKRVKLPTSVSGTIDGPADCIELPATTLDERRRLQALSSFYMQALEHALHLPSVLRVAYSTCSVHVEEDEAVVVAAMARANAQIGALRQRALRGADPGARGGLARDTSLWPWRLIPALPWWHRRGVPAPGLSEYERACLVRVDAAQDLSGGFFVALFERCYPRAEVSAAAGSGASSSSSSASSKGASTSAAYGSKGAAGGEAETGSATEIALGSKRGRPQSGKGGETGQGKTKKKRRGGKTKRLVIGGKRR